MATTKTFPTTDKIKPAGPDVLLIADDSDGSRAKDVTVNEMRRDIRDFTTGSADIGDFTGSIDGGIY